MAVELIRFLAAAGALILPGILLASGLQMGSDRLARCVYGAWLGIALAVYLGTAASFIDLRCFYPAWAALTIIAIVVRARRRRRPAIGDKLHQRWMIAVLLAVALSRYLFTLPQVLPMGVDPPQIHLILARKIQIAHHVVFDLLPFADAPINYPTGSHTLVAILSTISGVQVHTVFKDLIPLLGVMGSGLVCVFTRRATGVSEAGLYAAMAYGFWAGMGSIDFFNWGGLPNEISILFLLASFACWLEDWPRGLRIAAGAVCLAAMILTHHHTQLAAAGIFLFTIIWLLFHKPLRKEAGLLIHIGLAAVVLDGFYLVFYVPKATVLGHTNALFSEWPMNISALLPYMGLPFIAAWIAGMGFCLGKRRAQCHPVLFCGCAALLVMFLIFEYCLPSWGAPRGMRNWKMFTPSHFINDLPCFMAAFAGLAIAVVRQRLNLSRTAVLAAMLVAGLSVLPAWQAQAAGPGVTPDFIAACQWINANTSADSLVRGGVWANYLTWRRSENFVLPNSAEQTDTDPLREHLGQILQGTIPPDSPQMKLVEITDAAYAQGKSVLWRSGSGLEVVQVWP